MSNNAMRDYEHVLREAAADQLPARTLVASSTHRIFRVTVNGEDVACKVFRPQHPDVLDREWDGLSRLHEAGLDLAPSRLARSETAVVMSWLPGAVATGPSDALRVALTEMYGIELVPPSRLVRSTPTTVLERIDAVASVIRSPAAALAFLRGSEAEALRHVHLRNFVRGDGNLNNVLVHDGRVRFVDFEDCGRGDWALDLAEMTEHVASRGVPDREWLDFFDSFDPGPAERQRFASARRLYAIFWLGGMIRRRRGADARAQARRVAALLRDAS